MASRAAPSASSLPSLDQHFTPPKWWERAGDLSMASVAAVAFEWRAWLAWSIAVGVPASALLLALGGERSLSVSVPWWRSIFAGYVADVLPEPVACISATTFVLARQRRTPWRPSWVPWARLVWPILGLSALVHLGNVLIGLVLGWLSGFGSLGQYVVPWLHTLVACAYAALVLRAPVFVIRDGLGVRGALERSIREARGRLPELATACFLLWVLWGALELVVRVPDGLANLPACGSGGSGPFPCALELRLLWRWLVQALMAPLYVLAVIAEPPDQAEETAAETV